MANVQPGLFDNLPRAPEGFRFAEDILSKVEEGILLDRLAGLDFQPLEFRRLGPQPAARRFATLLHHVSDPEGAPSMSEDELDRIQGRMATAVAEEDFELAARLGDALARLGESEPSTPSRLRRQVPGKMGSAATGSHGRRLRVGRLLPSQIR